MKNLLTVICLIVTFSLIASATVINVPADQPSIQAGINAAVNGDTVLVADSTYYENINFMGKAITVASHFYIDGDTTHIDSTIIDGSNPSDPDSGSVVYFGSGEDTTSVLCGFTITGGTGTIYPQYNVRFGGGINFWFSGGRITSNKIVNNTLNDNTNWVIGGGVCGGYVGSNAYVILANNLIINNEANSPIGAFGGGVGLACNGRLIDNVISYNSCISTAFEANGGGIKTVSDTSLTITVLIKGNKITHNFAEGKEVTGHNGAKGGGIVNHYCKVIILENDILYNQVNAIDGGDAYGAGIGMVIANNESIISRNTISFNTIADSIPNSGGGILIRYSNILVTNNIISNNSASNGGGISSDNYRNPVIVNNTATSNGGGLYSAESNPVVLNTIFWDNYAANGAGIYPSSLTKVHYSDIQNGYSGTGNINADPQFSDTLFHLSEYSFCIGAGIDTIQIDDVWYYAPTIDIEGNNRPNPAGTMPDIGACESALTGFAVLKDINLSSKYIAINTDTLVITSDIFNPNSLNLQVYVSIQSTDTIFADSSLMYDDGNHDDGQANDGVWGGYFGPVSAENTYELNIIMSDFNISNDSLISIPEYFTSVGPVVFDSDSLVDAFGSSYKLYLNLRNDGLLATAKNVTAEISTTDSAVTSISNNSTGFGDIEAGQIKASTGYYTLFTSNLLPIHTLKFSIRIFSDGYEFWQDSADVVVGLFEKDAEIPKTFSLKQNYPNPFNPSTTIEFSIPKSEYVTLKVYNLLGQEMVDLVSKKLLPGNYKYSWDASAFASGVYFYKLEAGDPSTGSGQRYIKTKKLILIK